MKVHELIEVLNGLPQTLVVLVPGYECGAEEATTVRLATVIDRARPFRPAYEGRYELAQGSDDEFVALYISGDHDPL